MVKNLLANAGDVRDTALIPGSGIDEQRSLVCCSPWGRKDLDRTKQLN